MKMRERIKVIKTKRWVKVNKICAACKYKEIDEEGHRSCLKSDKKVGVCELCEHWRMTKGLRQACYRDGKVKSKEYLRIVKHVRMKENRALEKGKLTEEQCMTVEQLREEFCKAGGRMYSIH